jgi:hypothetical protein
VSRNDKPNRTRRELAEQTEEDGVEKILYFAYGSNMFTRRLIDRLSTRTRRSTAKPIAVGYLKGHRLTFDKVSHKDGSGKCDAEATQHEEDRVYGVVYELDKLEKRELDPVEGLGHGYAEKTVTVVSVSPGAKPIPEAVMYYATEKRAGLRPYHWYKAIVVAGAQEHELPAA